MRRKLIHHLLRLVTALCAVCACSVLAIIVWAIWVRGWPAISWQFFTEQIRLVGAAGGIFYNLIGTGILLLTALAVSAPLATGIALMHGVYWQHSRHRDKLTVVLYVLNGVPSILFGIFGMIVFVQWLGWGKSWLSGGMLLGFMILPTVTVALMERIASLPRQYVEAAAALGLTQSQTVRSVILPQSVSGLITGSLLGLARAAGETAPIMFTATIFAGATIPGGIKENPVLSLPYHIFILAQDSFDPSVGSKVWGTALSLLAVVFILNLIALPARLKIHEEARPG
ncbi:MAG TPA: phosphate ABC transporter permease PstA [Verrucomicrobiales bacterium]|jgi:phosphate transport system permease protein|nr:phosphate ABC transporter permease PstA [Verrucomicrobiales bacterium]